MKHRKLGKSELQVSVVGLGCNNFGFVANMDVEASRKVIDKYSKFSDDGWLIAAVVEASGKSADSGEIVAGKRN